MLWGCCQIEASLEASIKNKFIHVYPWNLPLFIEKAFVR